VKPAPNTGCMVPTCTDPKCKDPTHRPLVAAGAAPKRSAGNKDALLELALVERIALTIFTERISNRPASEAFAEAERFVQELEARRKRQREKPLLEELADGE